MSTAPLRLKSNLVKVPASVATTLHTPQEGEEQAAEKKGEQQPSVSRATSRGMTQTGTSAVKPRFSAAGVDEHGVEIEEWDYLNRCVWKCRGGICRGLCSLRIWSEDYQHLKFAVCINTPVQPAHRVLLPSHLLIVSFTEQRSWSHLAPTHVQHENGSTTWLRRNLHPQVFPPFQQGCLGQRQH